MLHTVPTFPVWEGQAHKDPCCGPIPLGMTHGSCALKDMPIGQTALLDNIRCLARPYACPWTHIPSWCHTYGASKVPLSLLIRGGALN